MGETLKQLQQTWRNPRIEAGRACALALLQPSEAELEHGFELHAQAIVVEPYGFSSIAAPDDRAIDTARQAGADPDEIDRIYLRSSMTRMADDAAQQAFFREAWEASGVTCVLRNSGEEGNHALRMLERLSYNTYVLDHMSDFLIRATSADDIRRAKDEGKRAFGLQLNGVPLPQEWCSVTDELRLIQLFFDLGVRMMHLTYNRRNVIGDGCVEPNDGGLSDFGRAVVAEMNRVGVIADLAHCSEATCLHTAATSTRPVMISHATCRALHEHPRAKSDDAIKAVAAGGGLIGICCLPNFLGRSGNIHAMLDHIDYAVQLVGADHVAIAPDLGLTAPGYERPEGHALRRRPKFENFQAPSRIEPFTSQQQLELIRSMEWTNWPLFTVGLVQRGYSDDQIARILGLNVLRVLEAAIA